MVMKFVMHALLAGMTLNMIFATLEGMLCAMRMVNGKQYAGWSDFSRCLAKEFDGANKAR